jgi:hypothetical protein
MVSRVGFNWDNGKKITQLRGGTGIFLKTSFMNGKSSNGIDPPFISC